MRENKTKKINPIIKPVVSKNKHKKQETVIKREKREKKLTLSTENQNSQKAKKNNKKTMIMEIHRKIGKKSVIKIFDNRK